MKPSNKGITFCIWSIDNICGLEEPKNTNPFIGHILGIHFICYRNSSLKCVKPKHTLNTAVRENHNILLQRWKTRWLVLQSLSVIKGSTTAALQLLTPDWLVSGFCPIWKQEFRPSDTTKTTRGRNELYIVKPHGKTKNNNPNLNLTNA